MTAKASTRTATRATPPVLGVPTAPPLPATTSTFPPGRSVAVWRKRADAIGAAAAHPFAAGS